MHESIERLVRLCSAWPRVALGSSGSFAIVGSKPWFNRMAEAMNAICDSRGRPMAKLHGLRMLDPAVFRLFPFASADSTHIGRSVGIDSKWTGSYKPPDKEWRAMVLAERIEATNASAVWRAVETQPELF